MYILTHYQIISNLYSIIPKSKIIVKVTKKKKTNKMNIKNKDNVNAEQTQWKQEQQKSGNEL